MILKLDIAGCCLIVWLAFMAAAWLLMEPGRERAFIRSIPAKFRALAAVPGGAPSEWTGPLHAAAPSALRAARHLAGLGHLLRPKGLSPWQAAMLARNLRARAARVCAPESRPAARADPAPGTPNVLLAAPWCAVSDHQEAGQEDPAAAERRQPPAPPPLPVTDVPGPEVGTADTRDGDPVTVAGDPAAAGSAAIDVLPPLPDLPPDGLDASCTYTDQPPFTDWERDSIVMAAIRVDGDWDAPLSAPREWLAELEDV